MKALTTFLLATISFINCQAQLNNYIVVFKPDQTTIEDSQKSQITDIVKNLKVNAKISIYPLAHDPKQDLYYFSKKAGEQAKAIGEYAKTLGFEVIGMPRNFPSGYSGFSVSVNLRYANPVALETEEVTPELPDVGLNEHYPDKNSQFFIINPKRDTVVYGDEGTKLLFMAGSLDADKDVKIELKEFYKLDDYLKNGLQTVSNGNTLASGGSIYIDAHENDSKGKQVKVNKDIGIGVDFTNGKNDTAMKIFIKDPRQQEFNWILPPTRTVSQSWSMTEITYDPYGKIIDKKVFNSKEEWEKHLKDKAAKAELEARKKEADRLKAEKEASIRRETNLKMESNLKIYNLGYINCDKFMDEPLINFIVNADTSRAAEYFLIYPEINSVLKGNTDGNKVYFSRISKIREAILIAVCFIGKQAYFFKCKIGQNGKLNSRVILAPVSESFVNEQLAALKKS